MLTLDLSTADTGWATATAHGSIRPPHKLSKQPRGARLLWWNGTLRTLIAEHTVPGALVLVEAPFVHLKHASSAIPLAMLHGVVEMMCAELDRRHDSVTPGELKKWATGKGNAKKPEMIAAARALGCATDNDNVADAFLLLHFHESTHTPEPPHEQPSMETAVAVR